MPPTLQSLRLVDADTAEVVIHFEGGPRTYRIVVLRGELDVLEGTEALYADLYAWPSIYKGVYESVSRSLASSRRLATGTA